MFAVPPEGSCRRFCSVACRLALRRVLDREARYRQRRRRWRRQRLRARRGAAGHLVSMSLRFGNLVADSLKFPRPQTEEGAGGHERVSCPPFPFFERGSVEGTSHALGRRHGQAGVTGGVGPAVIAAIGWRIRRRRKRWPARFGVGVSCRRWWRAVRGRAVGTARWLQALGGGAAGGRADELERARAGSG